MIWVISVHPEYVAAMLAGRKKMEVRKSVPKFVQPMDIIFVVETGSGGIIKCVFMVDRIVKLHPQKMWEIYSHRMAIAKKDYDEYFRFRAVAYGIVFDNVAPVEGDVPISEAGLQCVPQWFSLVRTMSWSMANALINLREN